MEKNEKLLVVGGFFYAESRNLPDVVLKTLLVGRVVKLLYLDCCFGCSPSFSSFFSMGMR